MMEEGKEWCGEHIIHNGFKIILKSVNLQCNTLVCWFRRDKVLFFFTISCKILFKTCLNSFLNFFYSKNKEFWVPQVYKKLWKRIMLGTLDAWSMSLLFRRLREPVYYIVDWRISRTPESEMTNLLWFIWFCALSSGTHAHSAVLICHFWSFI